jgi:hypothetical protein
MRAIINITLLFAVAALIWVPTPGFSQAASNINHIEVFFKLDHRITRGVYMGDRWVSPPTYTRVGLVDQKEIIVVAKAQGINALGEMEGISPEWIPEAPDMISVSPSQGHQVNIAIKQEGQSTLKVVSKNFSRELLIKAEYKDGAMRVAISQ